MKLPESLMHAILVGITVGTMSACSMDEVVAKCDKIACDHQNESCAANANEEQNHYPCPACGMG